jgi:hypothetical protein
MAATPGILATPAFLTTPVEPKTNPGRVNRNIQGKSWLMQFLAREESA